MESAHYTLKATFSNLCTCSRDIHNQAAYQGQPESIHTLWRPWVQLAGDRGQERSQRPSNETEGEQSSIGSKGALGFQHPVRLYMPKSKTDEYLQHMGKKVLASFPVQATIHFYNDDSDSEEEEDEYESSFYNHYQNTGGNLGKEFGHITEEEDPMLSSGRPLTEGTEPEQ